MGVLAFDQLLKFFTPFFLTKPFETEKNAYLVKALQCGHTQPGRKGQKIALASIEVLRLIW